MKEFGILFLALCSALAGASQTVSERASIIVAVGAPGQKDYGEAFAAWARNWQRAGDAAHARVAIIGLAVSKEGDLAALKEALEKETKEGAAPLWLVFVGHGTADNREAKFNFAGDDLSAATLAEWIRPFKRPLILIHSFSASGAFLAPLTAPGRVVISATKSGAENNFSRLGKYLSEAIIDSAADLDHDGQTSLLEAWLSAAQQTDDFYKSEGRLATEHSLLDDNGDGRGTPADWFRGIRVVKKSADRAPDGLRAHQIHLLPSKEDELLSFEERAQRDALEAELAALRETKTSLPEKEYYEKLETILLRIGRLYRKEEKPRAETPGARVRRVARPAPAP